MTEQSIKELRELLDWIEKPKRGRKGVEDFSADVTIVNLNKKEGECFQCTLRNGCFEFIGDYVQLATNKSKTRLFFASATKDDGYKLTSNPTGKNRYFQVRLRETNKILKKFVGNYRMKYSEDLDLYYIEKEKVWQ